MTKCVKIDKTDDFHKKQQLLPRITFEDFFPRQMSFMKIKKVYEQDQRLLYVVYKKEKQ